MKTLKTIQTLAKIGKIFSKIIFICSIIGLCGCFIGIVALGIGQETLKLGGMTLHNILETEAGTSLGTVWSAIVVGIFLCGGELAVSHLAHRYFSHELDVGTPFTQSGATELMRLGIHVIWIPVASTICAKIAHEIICNLMTNVEELSLGFDSVALGIMFIVASVLCRYGAELNETKNAENDIDTQAHKIS